MPDRKLRLGEELISPLHALYDGLQVDGAPRPAHRAAEHPVWVVTRYRDARKVLNHPGVRRDARQAAELYAKRTGSPRAGIGEGLSHHMLNLDRRTIPACARWLAARSPRARWSACNRI